MSVQSLLENMMFILAIPFLCTFLLYIIMDIFRVHKWRKIHLTVQYSALFYVAGVIVVVNEMYGLFILSYVLIAFILFLAIHITIQWKKQMPISLVKSIVLLLRIVFLLFFLSYLILLTMYAIRIFA